LILVPQLWLPFFSNDQLYIANCGDSRAVISEKKRAQTITVDHKPNSETEKKRIESIPGGYIHKNRVQGKLAVARSLGDFSLNPYVSPEPDIFGPFFWKDPERNYNLLILACDGLWDVTSEDEAVQIAGAAENPREAAIRLRDDAYDKRSRDNISVLVIWFPGFVPDLPKKESSSEESGDSGENESESGSGSGSGSESEEDGEEKTPRDRVKTPREKTPREKTPREKTPREKSPREKTPREKIPREKNTSGKNTTGKNTTEKNTKRKNASRHNTRNNT